MQRYALCLYGCVALGCASGKTPPTPTSTVRVEATANNKVEYEFGSTVMCADGEESTAEACKSRPSPKSYPTMVVRIPPFTIDETEVTNLQYQHCVARGNCTEPAVVNALGGGAFDKYYDEDSSTFDNHPVVNITWLQARDYCNFVGKRLPTEFEWEATVKLGKTPNNTVYPWGDALGDCSGKSVALAGCTADFGFPQAVKGAMTDDVVLIGTREVHGLYGNVAEWVDTEYDEDVSCKEPISGCANAYDECAGDTGSDWSKCVNKHEECLECLPDPQDLSTLNPACYGACLETTDPVWVCKRHSAPVEDPKAEGDGNRGFRGGNYTTQNRCAARGADRIEKKLGQTESSPFIGFRCAQTL